MIFIDESIKPNSKKSNQLITFRGILLPVDWDEDGHVIALVLSGTDEKEYQIEVNDKKAELFALLQKEVEVTGLLRERAGNSVIVLNNYRMCERNRRTYYSNRQERR
jgi:dipeptidyl aminopeptidase/acylaminoacyl peptidase